MLPRGPAKKVTCYLNEDTKANVEPLWSVVLSFLRHHHVSGVTMFRADAGFGSHERLHRAASEYLNEHRPVRIEFVETLERVEQLLPALYEMVTDGLLTVQDCTVIKNACKDRPTRIGEPGESARAVLTKPAKVLRIYLAESDKYEGRPLYEAIVNRFRMEECAGVTVYRGILGFGHKGHTRKEGHLNLAHDLPIMICVIDQPDQVAGLIRIASGMMQNGIIVTSDAEVSQIVHQLPQSEGSIPNERSNR